MAVKLNPAQLLEYERLRAEAFTLGKSRFDFEGQVFVLGADGQVTHGYPKPEGQTHEAIANMRELFPMLVGILQLEHVQKDLMNQGKKVNWDVINDVERQCGLPQTPCPNSIATQRCGLKKDGGS